MELADLQLCIYSDMKVTF